MVIQNGKWQTGDVIHTFTWSVMTRLSYTVADAMLVHSGAGLESQFAITLRYLSFANLDNHCAIDSTIMYIIIVRTL